MPTQLSTLPARTRLITSIDSSLQNAVWPMTSKLTIFLNSRWGNSVLNRVRFRPATNEQHLTQLDPSKAIGPDGIPAQVLKHCAKALAYHFLVLFHCTFSAVLSLCCGRLQTVPIHKKHSRTAVKNYRPASLLCVTSKVMEKVVINGKAAEGQSKDCAVNSGRSSLDQLARHSSKKKVDEKFKHFSGLPTTLCFVALARYLTRKAKHVVLCRGNQTTQDVKK